MRTGTFSTRSEQIHHDTADETHRDILEAHISSFCCSQNLGSFYNGAGEIDSVSLAGSCWLRASQASSSEKVLTSAVVYWYLTVHILVKLADLLNIFAFHVV